MGVYNNNNGVLTPIANETQFIAPVNEYVTKPELDAIVPSDTSADNKLVNSDEVDGKIDDVWKVQGELGAKNLLPYQFNSPYVSSGITVNKNENGSIKLNGTTTAYFSFSLSTLVLKAGDYTLSTTNTLPASVYLQVIKSTGSPVLASIGNGVSKTVHFTLNEDTEVRTRIVIPPIGTTITDLDIFPMVHHKSDTSDVWQPFVKTNRELTEDIKELTDVTNITAERVNTTDYFYPDFAMFNTFGVIGDSYSSGYIAPNPNVNEFVTNYSLSWCQILARICGNVCTNFTKPGVSTKSWLTTSDYGKTALEAAPALDLYIVCLGINDYLHASYNLGTSADIGNNADSFYGYYSQIIEAIRAHAPNASIILSTMVNGRTGGSASFTADQVNEAIAAIAEYYGVPYIRPSEDALFRSNYYLTKKSQGHPVATVYSAMAKAYKRLIEKAMEDYFDYFKDYVG